MRIDIFQDTVCPWCRIGKQHLFAAIERWDEEPMDIYFRTFLLDPTAPEEGRPSSSLAEKLGGEERVTQAHAQVCRIGEACGLNFDFKQIDKLPNSMLSHQLIQITPHDKQIQMVDAITKAYFEDGKDIGKSDVLLDIAEAIGLNRDETEVRLTRGDGKEGIDRDLSFAREVGISGVPLFILNNRYAISGAQPVDSFLAAFKQARFAD